MIKRKYTHIKIIEPKLIAMREAGKTNREIAEYFGFAIIGSRLVLLRDFLQNVEDVPENIRHQPTFKSISMRLSV